MTQNIPQANIDYRDTDERMAEDDRWMADEIAFQCGGTTVIISENRRETASRRFCVDCYGDWPVDGYGATVHEALDACLDEAREGAEQE